MATIKFTDVTLTVNNNHLMTFTDATGQVFIKKQCGSLAEVLRETALFAIYEYHEAAGEQVEKLITFE